VIFLAVAATAAADPPVGRSFDWRVTATVTRTPQGSDQDATTVHQASGSGTITVVRDASPDVRFAFQFTSPAGNGSGVIPSAAEDRVDPNFSFPNPLPAGLPAADRRLLRSEFRRGGTGRVPPSFDIVYSEIFICRLAPEQCGNVKRWELTFVGSARLTPAGR
jgi:hypothetical protein